MAHATRRRFPLCWLAVWVVGLLSACGDDGAGTPQQAPLAVTTTPVAALPPEGTDALTGVAEPYRQADVAFEVPGRLVAALDVGREVEVVTHRDQDDTLVTRGEVIAQIDPTTYTQRLQGARLRVATARAGLEAAALELDEVAPAAVARAKSQRDAATADVASARARVQSAESTERTRKADLDRSKRLSADRQVSRAELDQAQNAYDTAAAGLIQARAGLEAALQQVAGLQAAVSEAEASLRLKAASLTRMRAELNELQLAVTQAETDLTRCTLRAPFAGRITALHASHGDFVQAGTPVVTLTLIDPIKVSVTVSAQRERQIRPGEHAFVLPAGIAGFAGANEQLTGTVFEKGSIADAATRTFRVDIMVRNARRRLNEAGDSDGATPITFRQLLPAVQEHFGEPGPLFVCTSCLTGDGGRRTVVRIPGVRFGHPRAATLLQAKLPLQRIEVAPTGDTADDYMQILNWTFQRVRPAGDPQLEPGDLLLNFDGLDPSAVQEGVTLERFEWAIRPGDLVPVRFQSRPTPEGLYVPDAAIVAKGEQRVVYVLDKDRVRAVSVGVSEGGSTYKRIESDAIRAGQPVVLRGAHYCFEGAAVKVTATDEAASR